MKRSAPKLWHKLLAAAVWLALWQAASAAISQEMLLASPVLVVRRLWELVLTPEFRSSVFFSLSRVAAGFLLALLLGIVLAALAYPLRPVEILLEPFMSAVKAAPVASYIILCLLFLPSRSLSIFISLLMALPVIYTNVLTGLQNTDRKLLEMARVFRMSLPRRIRYIYFSQLTPSLLAACSLSLGLCWKAGVAAEVIGLPRGSIGEQMYQAKIFLDSPSLLAWTVVVVAVSFLFEKAFLALLRRLAAALERR